jgi:hypothetical protein
MSALNNEIRAQKIWFDDDNIWVQFTDGRQLAVPFVYFPRLHNATPDQRNNYEMSGGGYGIHWHELDEDICVPKLLSSNLLQKAV